MKAEKIILYAIIVLLGIGFLLTIFGIVYGNISNEKKKLAQNNSANQTAFITISPTITTTSVATITPTSTFIPTITSTQTIPTLTPTTSITITSTPKATPKPTSIPTKTPTPTATPTSTPNPTPIYTYRNGTYTINQPYSSPGGTDSIAVTLTIQNDIATVLANSYTYHSGESRTYQQSFESQIHPKVETKSLPTLGNLSRVGGASLTTNAFNQALTKIKTNATN